MVCKAKQRLRPDLEARIRHPETTDVEKRLRELERATSMLKVSSRIDLVREVRGRR